MSGGKGGLGITTVLCLHCSKLFVDSTSEQCKFVMNYFVVKHGILSNLTEFVDFLTLSYLKNSH